MPILKIQQLVPLEQPTVVAGGVAIKEYPTGPRVGVVYAQLTVIKAAGGAGVTSLPLLTDIADPAIPLTVKIGGTVQRNRTASELIAMNKLQGTKFAGSVQYFQAGALVATVLSADNTVAPAALATNTATTAVFMVPIYFAEPWRKNPDEGEALALPTLFAGGVALADLTTEIPLANNAGAVFSGHNAKMWWEMDTTVWPLVNGQPKPFFTKQGRFTKAYGLAGDLSITLPAQKDALQQISFIAATGDTFTKVLIKKNGVVLRDVTKAQNDQGLLSNDLNSATGIVANRFDVVFDINDYLNSTVPLQASDTFEITVTLATVAGNAQMVILTESYGQPD